MNISEAIKETKQDDIPLHELRYNQMKAKSLESKLYPNHTHMVHPTVQQQQNKLFNGDSKGKDLSIKPLVYYNLQDCLKNVMTETDFVDKAKKNIGIIKANRESKGQRLAVHSDLKDVQGEYGDKTEEIMAGFEKLKFYRIVREWCGYICIFEIKRQNIGFGQTKRQGYTIDKVYVCYYGKNGIHIGKELILRISFWMWNKPTPRDHSK